MPHPLGHLETSTLLPSGLVSESSTSSAPHCGIVKPSTTRPALKSMSSFIRSKSPLLLDIFTTGAMGKPAGVPRPVVKRQIWAPAASIG